MTLSKSPVGLSAFWIWSPYRHTLMLYTSYTACLCFWHSLWLHQCCSVALYASLRATQHKYVGAFLTAVDDVPIFTLARRLSASFSWLRVTSQVTAFRMMKLAPEPVVHQTCLEQAAVLQEMDLPDQAATLDENDLALPMLRAIHVDPTLLHLC
jgi:hypothetical protein